MTAAPLPEPVRDLGDVDGPLIAFGGPLSNLDALDALMARAEALGIAPAAMISTGDTVAYGADPEACAQRLKESGVHVVMGNCEEALAEGAGDCGCNFATGSTCDALAGRWYSYAQARISDETRAWMAALPRRIDFAMAGVRFSAVHGGVHRINRYLFASDAGAIAEALAALDADVAIAGHAGLPFSRTVGARLWHNPGALGLPANDGTPRVWYSVIAPEGQGVALARCALAYDHEAQAARMRAAGLPEAYAAALETGLWPDTAILPGPEAAATGRPLDPGSVTFEPLRGPPAP